MSGVFSCVTLHRYIPVTCNVTVTRLLHQGFGGADDRVAHLPGGGEELIKRHVGAGQHVPDNRDNYAEQEGDNDEFNGALALLGEGSEGSGGGGGAIGVFHD